MGNNFSSMFILDNKNFDQDPEWIKHFDAIKCTKKTQWSTLIKEKYSITTSNELDQSYRTMSNDIDEYHRKQAPNLWLARSCRLTKHVLMLDQEKRENHLKECPLCEDVWTQSSHAAGDQGAPWSPDTYRLSVPHLKDNHQIDDKTMEAILKEAHMRLIVKEYDIDQKLKNDIKEDLNHLMELHNFISKRCFRKVYAISDEMEKTEVIIRSKPHVRMTIGDFYEMVYDIKLYNEAELDFEKQKEKHPEGK